MITQTSVLIIGRKQTPGLVAIHLRPLPVLTLMVGANRGIGLNLMKSFVQRSYEVTGTIRPQTKNDPSVDKVRKS